LPDAIEFYDQRFGIALTAQQKANLVGFLNALIPYLGAFDGRATSARASGEIREALLAYFLRRDRCHQLYFWMNFYSPPLHSIAEPRLLAAPRKGSASATAEIAQPLLLGAA
jgi:hypothetical protein